MSKIPSALSEEWASAVHRLFKNESSEPLNILRFPEIQRQKHARVWIYIYERREREREREREKRERERERREKREREKREREREEGEKRRERYSYIDIERDSEETSGVIIKPALDIIYMWTASVFPIPLSLYGFMIQRSLCETLETQDQLRSFCQEKHLKLQQKGTIWNIKLFL